MAMITKIMMRWGLLVARVESDEKAPRAPRKLPSGTRVISMDDLRRRHKDVGKPDALARRFQGGELSFDPNFKDVYAEARLREPEHGWTIERVIRLLNGDAWRSKSRDEIKADLRAKLDADEAAVDDVVVDALRRDEALDAFEEHSAAELAEQEAAHKERETHIKRQMQQWIKELEAEKKLIEKNRQKLEQWREKKRAMEAAMADALLLFTDKVKITRS